MYLLQYTVTYFHIFYSSIWLVAIYPFCTLWIMSVKISCTFRIKTMLVQLIINVASVISEWVFFILHILRHPLFLKCTPVAWTCFFVNVFAYQLVGCHLHLASLGTIPLNRSAIKYTANLATNSWVKHNVFDIARHSNHNWPDEAMGNLHILFLGTSWYGHKHSKQQWSIYISEYIIKCMIS